MLCNFFVRKLLYFQKVFWPWKQNDLKSIISTYGICTFFLCKQPRIEYPFYRLLYPMICGTISGHVPNECTVPLEPDSICSKLSEDVFSFPVLCIQYKLNFGLRSQTFLRFILKTANIDFSEGYTSGSRKPSIFITSKWAEIQTRLT